MDQSPTYPNLDAVPEDQKSMVPERFHALQPGMIVDYYVGRHTIGYVGREEHGCARFLGWQAGPFQALLFMMVVEFLDEDEEPTEVPGNMIMPEWVTEPMGPIDPTQRITPEMADEVTRRIEEDHGGSVTQEQFEKLVADVHREFGELPGSKVATA